jgi:hypothetical protein
MVGAPFGDIAESGIPFRVGVSSFGTFLARDIGVRTVEFNPFGSAVIGSGEAPRRAGKKRKDAPGSQSNNPILDQNGGLHKRNS